MKLYKTSIIAFVLLALFFAHHNIGTIAYQMRGLPPKQLPVVLSIYYIVIFLGAIGFDILTRQQTRQGNQDFPAHDRNTSKILCLLVLLLLLPVCITPVAHYLEREGRGIALLSMVATAGWVLYVPVCFYFFRTRVPTRLYMLYYGLALGGGHVLWALLAPVVGPLTAQAPAMAIAPAQQYQLMLNLLRGAMGAAICFIIYWLARWVPPLPECMEQSIPATNKNNTRTASLPDKAANQGFPSLFLIPLSLIFFMNGFANNIYSARIHTSGPYPGLMHLAIACVFCLSAFSLQNNKALLKPYLYGTFLLMAASPLLFLAQPESNLYQALYSLFSVGHHCLILFGAFIALAHAPYSKWPLTATCSAWLITGMSLPGGVAAKLVLPHLPLSQFAALGICSAVALALFPLLRRAFPLPETMKNEQSETPQNINVTTGCVAAFAAQHEFTQREADILHLLSQGASTADMAQALTLKDSSIYRYVTSMLKKSGVDSRRALLNKFSTFTPPDESKVNIHKKLYTGKEHKYP